MKKLYIRCIAMLMAVAVILTATSCAANFKKNEDPLLELEFTEFPTKAYDADKVHPVRKTGDLSGEEAVTELSLIEWDYIRHSLADDYVAASWSCEE